VVSPQCIGKIDRGVDNRVAMAAVANCWRSCGEEEEEYHGPISVDNALDPVHSDNAAISQAHLLAFFGNIPLTEEASDSVPSVVCCQIGVPARPAPYLCRSHGRCAERSRDRESCMPGSNKLNGIFLPDATCGAGAACTVGMDGQHIGLP